MTRIGAAAAGVLAAAGAADAQTAAMPFGGSGVPVGRAVLQPVGKQAPAAAGKVGTPIGHLGADGRPVNTDRPPGKVIDLTNLAAPVTAPLPPGLTTPKPAWRQVYDKWAAALGLVQPTTTTAISTYTPGLSRRARERRDAAWRRD